LGLRPGSTLLPYATLFRSRGHRGNTLCDPQRKHIHRQRGGWIVGRQQFAHVTRLAGDSAHPAFVVQRLLEGIQGETFLAQQEKRSEEHTSELQSREKLVCR